ncbi:YheC/YheD family protein [Gracilibacillus kekensis]|uniref:YheC/D like ATP-grasp n=1 Tax=Gracilibacillus kekensis TaxID=1027249 RepID=A0A1M7J5G3_9BACI|nr:YheC/YheD family protein [Gracilibacillus kekensis]SHM48113.1 YheC/D like ATP-grasp [Gracilibacillus kekensis]
MLPTLQIKVYHINKNRIIVPKSHYFRMKDVKLIHHGFKKVPCEVLSHNQKQNTVYLSSSIMKHLHLKNQSDVIIYSNKNSCSIYYLFGVLVHQQPNKLKHEPLYQEMARVGHTLGFETILFSPQDLDRISHTTNGSIFQQHNWTKIETDIPPVIYNRIPNRAIENHTKIKQAKSYLKTTSILFNPHFFDKWHVYDQLKNSDDVNYLLPETTFHPSQTTINEALTQHPIYLNPLSYSKKYNKYYIEKVDNRLFVAITGKQKEHSYFESTELFFNEYFPKGAQQYVLQDAIRYMEVQGEPFLFRIYTLKNFDNQWRVVLHYMKKFVLSSYDTSETVIPLSMVFTKKEAAAMLKKLDDIALKLSSIVDAQMDNSFGELGFDIGLDQENRLWLAEVYAKPSWDIFYHPAIASKTSTYFTQLFNIGLSKLKVSE